MNRKDVLRQAIEMQEETVTNHMDNLAKLQDQVQHGKKALETQIKKLKELQTKYLEESVDE